MVRRMPKATLAAANLHPVDVSEPIDLTLPRRELYDLLVSKYGKMINDLGKLDYHAWSQMDEEKQRLVLIILEKLRNHKEFGQSVPSIDLEWVLDMLNVFRMEEIRAGLNKAALWLSSNPDRKKKNYRRFLLNWISSESKEVKKETHIHYHGDV
jgi:hypothetical protein